MNAAEHLLGEAALARHGARAALYCGDECVTYAALAARVRGAANAYAKAGVDPGDRVLVLLRDTPSFAVAWLGALWRGAVPVGLNNKLGDADLRHIGSDSGARLLVTEASLAREIGVPSVDARAIDCGDGTAQPHLGSPERPAFWLYSSGTTGRPKGVVHAHRAVLASGQAQREVLGISAGDCVLTTSKLFFAYALENGLLGPLVLGASSVLVPDWAEPEGICELVARSRPAAFFSVPSFYRRLLALQPQTMACFRHVRRFTAAGERLPAQIVQAWRSATGGELLSIYGMSETYCVSIMTRPGSSTGGHTGTPLDGVDARLEGAAGTPGELWLKHPALALGYANRPKETQEQFRDGWFCTRDMFARDANGNYVHQGRSDELVKVSGQWVRPGEIEETVLAVPAVADAACVPFPDNDGLERLALFVTARGDPDAAAKAAGEACNCALQRHQRPKWIRAIAELPRTATGKVQRFRLREILAREFPRND